MLFTRDGEIPGLFFAALGNGYQKQASEFRPCGDCGPNLEAAFREGIGHGGGWVGVDVHDLSFCHSCTDQLIRGRQKGGPHVPVQEPETIYPPEPLEIIVDQDSNLMPDLNEDHPSLLPQDTYGPLYEDIPKPKPIIGPQFDSPEDPLNPNQPYDPYLDPMDDLYHDDSYNPGGLP